MADPQSDRMRRMQLVELEDLPWFPRVIRNGGTDWLGFMANHTPMFAGVAPAIRRAMQATGTDRIIDLCSGGGGPWLTLERELRKTGPVTVELSDLYPNSDARAYLRQAGQGRLTFHPGSVDATDVSPSMGGVRTMFNSFHHFPPELAKAILADAVRKRRAIAIFEGGFSRWLVLTMPLQLPALLIFTPFVRPFRWSRLFLTYLVPVIPFLVLFDGMVSMLRIYLPDELRELVGQVPGHETFDWDIGMTTGRAPFGPLHLIGTPKP